MTLEEKASQMQNHAHAIARLGVPDYNYWSEALHGVVALHRPTTVFPEPIGLAASFDAPLVRRMAEAIALEARVRHRQALQEGGSGLFEGLTFYSPNINLFRDPRWGRGQETYGEDPLLTARMGVAFIRGLQGEDPSHPRVAATAKHFAVHSGPEPLRHGFDARVSQHDLEDSYLPAFRAAVVEGQVASVMCVYNAVNGVPGCASEELLQRRLRQQWGFRGYVVSDCDAVTDISAHHHYAGTSLEARALAVKAGMDNECRISLADFGVPMPAGAPDYQDYVDAVHSGKLTEADLDRALRRGLAWRFALDMFDPPGTAALDRTADAVADGPAHRALALEAARRSMVLLKNDGVLPLSGALRKIAVVGPLAEQRTVLLGNYNGTPSRSTTVLEGMRAQFAAAEVAYAAGGDFPGEPLPVPVSWFSTDDGRPGIEAQYFAAVDLAGKPFLSRVEPYVVAGPAATATAGRPEGGQKYAIRWRGYLTPTESGSYLLGLQGDSNALWFDGKLLVDARGPHIPDLRTQPVELVAGRRYAIEIQSLPAFSQAAHLVLARRETLERQIQRAVSTAHDADVVVAVVGITSQLEGEESNVDLPGFKGGDRTTLDLPAQEQSLLEALHATGKPLIVVLMNGSPLAVNWAQQNASAILEAWYPGEEGGRAVAETLAGANNPAGRLPVTFYKGVEQLPPFEDYSMANRTYRYFSGEPLYPFGYGLSYSSFAYRDLRLSARKLRAGQTLVASVEVSNASARDGDEVVQLYVEFPRVPGAPRRALRGFERVHLAAGESRRVRLTLAPRDQSYVDADGRRLVGPGSYLISVGGGQPRTGAPGVAAQLQILGRKLLDP
jgi:beta-glucosidase